MKVLLYILFFTGFLGFGQHILENSNGQILRENPMFNQGFIKKAKIKRIKGVYSTKASMDIIRESNQFYTYEFDNEGRLIREYLTKNNDTVVKLYTYDSKSRMIYFSESNYYGYKSIHYVYDSLNRIILLETRRETNLNKSKIDFNRDESYEISNERFEYIPLENGNYKKLYYNASDRIFKEEIVYHREDKKVKNQEIRMMMGSARKQISYTYHRNGQVLEYYSESWIMGHNTFKYVYEYDDDNQVLAAHYYKNSHYKTEYQFIYNQQTAFLQTILTRDENTDFITILKLADYSFY